VTAPAGADRIAAVVLAAGEGRRLRPLTETVPKALCPVGNVPLLDLAIDRLAGLGITGTGRLAVNACYLGAQVVTHLRGRAHPSVEPGQPLGTAGGIGNLRGWIDGRAVLVGNVDAYLSAPHLPPGADIAAMLDGWDGGTVRLLGVPAPDGRAGEFGGYLFAGFSLLPWADVVSLGPDPASLVRTTWRPAERAGRLEVIEYQGHYLDTGTPGDYLAANLHAAAARAGGGNLVAGTAISPGGCGRRGRRRRTGGGSGDPRRGLARGDRRPARAPGSTRSAGSDRTVGPPRRQRPYHGRGHAPGRTPATRRTLAAASPVARAIQRVRTAAAAPESTAAAAARHPAPAPP
jgi:hypothetical protein